MTLLPILMAAAHAQNPPTLADDPNHDAYVHAVGALDHPLPIGIRGWEPQIAPGTVGFVKSGTGSIIRGYLVATKDLGTDDLFLESLVYKAEGTIESINAGSFTIQYSAMLTDPSEEGMDDQLGVWDGQDPGDLYQGGADANGSVGGAKFVVSNNAVPDDVDLDNPDLNAITPLTSDCLDLYGFELYQSGAIVGWLLRERRDYGDDGVVWVDHWFYRSTFKPVSNAAPQLLVRAPTTLSNPDGVWSVGEFIDVIKLDAPVNTPTGLNRHHVSMYTFDGLADLLVP